MQKGETINLQNRKPIRVIGLIQQVSKNKL